MSPLPKRSPAFTRSMNTLSSTDALKLDCPSEKRHLLPSTNTAESGESIKRLLSNLGAIGQGLGELRNL